MQHKKKKEEHDKSGDNVMVHQGESGEPTGDILDSTRRFLELQERYTESKKKTSELYAELEKLEIELYEKMKNIGIDQFRNIEFGLISCANTLYGKIDDLDLASEWLKEEGLFEEILQYTPKKARVNELLKKRIEEGLDIPPGFNYYVTKSISCRAK